MDNMSVAWKSLNSTCKKQKAIFVPEIIERNCGVFLFVIDVLKGFLPYVQAMISSMVPFKR